jgi:hypothetical protein
VSKRAIGDVYENSYNGNGIFRTEGSHQSEKDRVFAAKLLRIQSYRDSRRIELPGKLKGFALLYSSTDHIGSQAALHRM